MRLAPLATLLLQFAFSATAATAIPWEPVGLSGGGAMFAPAISPIDPNLMMLNCDMSAAYISENGGHDWRMITATQLHSDIRCRPAFHPTNRDIIYASSGHLKISLDRGRTFTRIGNLTENLGGEIAICPAQPSLMLAGTWNGQTLRSHNGGTNWTRCPELEGKVLGFHFTRTNAGRTCFAATQKGIWRSQDAGETWTDKTTCLPWKNIQGFSGGSEPSSSTILYCTVESKVENGAFRGGVYSSRDLGETWQPALGTGLNLETTKADEYAYGPVSQYHQVLTTDAKPQTVYVMNTSTGFHPPHFDTVFRSDDAGQHWRATYYMDPRFAQFNVGHDYVTASTGKSFKGGETPFGAAICNSDPERLLLVRNECHVTHDGGKSWFSGHTKAAGNGKAGPDTAWLCSGLVVTTTWHYYADPFEPNRHYICYTDIGWARSLDAGKSWLWWNDKTWPPWRNTCYELAFDPEIHGKIWGAFSDVHDIPNDNIIGEHHGHNHPGGVCLSMDFGASWKPIGSTVDARRHDASALPPKAVTSVVLDPHSAKGSRTLYAGVFDVGVFKSNDDGKSWTLKSHGLGAAENMRVSRVLLHQDGSLFVMICAKRAGSGKPLMSQGVGLYRSKDGAETWQKVNASQPLLYPKDFSVHPNDSKRLLIGACDTGGGDHSGGLYSSDDAGETWRKIGREGPQTFGGYFHPKQDGWLYMTLTEGAPGAGLWFSHDNGKTWKPVSELPFSNIQRVEFLPSDQERLYATTFGGGVWRGPVEPVQD